MKTFSNIFADLITLSNGKFVTVTFIKKDGSERKMNCRIGVKKHLRGGACTVNTDKYLIVYDVQSKGYRSIDKDAIIALSINGESVAMV